MKLLYIVVFLSISSFAMASAPEAKIGNTSVARALTSDSNADISSSSSFDACNVHFSDYKFPTLSEDEYFKRKSPISEWSCLYSGEAFEAGYDTRQVNTKGISVSSTDNKIVYDYKNKIWKLIPDTAYVKNGKINHLSLVQVKSKNASGFMTVNSMAKLIDGTLGESIYFCLIHKNNALCGSGINSPDDKNEELSKDALKLLESISFDDN
ncbi:hypothetical protein [Enterobacter sp. RHBSTW-01064]|uniref:hypothetical protein n=1 Tax=Enterobacter sp. RHBSTW-01064 TaxID=2742679 RepID=UPI0020179D0D|nr:hypothetical protein [Enterobacter sp. RHBSTW-01064]